MHWVYILKCADGSFYVGETVDPAARERYHNEGKGGRYTRLRRPVHLAYSEALPSRQAAIQRERQLKRWTAAKKAALVANDPVALRNLSKRRGRP